MQMIKNKKHVYIQHRNKLKSGQKINTVNAFVFVIQYIYAISDLILTDFY